MEFPHQGRTLKLGPVWGTGKPQPDKSYQHIMFSILEAEEPDESESDEPEPGDD